MMWPIFLLQSCCEKSCEALANVYQSFERLVESVRAANEAGFTMFHTLLKDPVLHGQSDHHFGETWFESCPDSEES